MAGKKKYRTEAEILARQVRVRELNRIASAKYRATHPDRRNASALAHYYRKKESDPDFAFSLRERAQLYRRKHGKETDAKFMEKYRTNEVFGAKVCTRNRVLKAHRNARKTVAAANLLLQAQ
jgi:hypothetical protein